MKVARIFLLLLLNMINAGSKLLNITCKYFFVYFPCINPSNHCFAYKFWPSKR